MGLLDKMSPLMTRISVAFVLVGLFAICIAMCVAPPYAEYLYNVDTTGLDTGDTAWMLTSSALVLIMTPGIAFFYGGMMHHKNVVATICVCILPMAIIPIVWAFIGFSLALGPDAGYPGFIGTGFYGLMYRVGGTPEMTMPLSIWVCFQMMFAIITPAIILGAIADRVNFSAVCLFIPVWHILVYCPVCHMVWTSDGLINRWGVLDFAGGMVVHMSSGYAALAASFYLGPRVQRNETDGPANVPYVVLGTALLWFGWFGFNAGSGFGANVAAANAFLATTLATACAMFAWILCDQIRGEKFKATGMCLGVVVGLVAITPAAGYVNFGAACLIGILGTVFAYGVQMLMNKYGRKYFDDTLDVFACHGIGGTVGMICTSLFQSEAAGASVNGAFYGNGVELGKCLAALVCLVPWFMLFTYGALMVTNLLITVRVDEAEELEGLDVSKHGEAAMHVGDGFNTASKAGNQVSRRHK